MAQDDGFLSRWSRRKVQARQGENPGPAPLPMATPAEPVQAAVQAAVQTPVAPAPEPVPAPTLDDVATLTRESDFARFVTPEVPGEVRNAALRKLFSDPHFNVMDGLDTYIDDYNTPDPLPAAMLRQMAQAAYLGLVEPRQEEQAPPPECAAGDVPAAIPAPDAVATEPHDEDPDLRLQSHHDPGPPGAGPRAGGDAGGQC
ncbi:DUF3306 domain-containing protein [Pseudorhodoferax sp.]|uniref:DUF3306 domain-containing protein n=1 Tax=Pseudorhodoferax sp. TaxID=1993553 RepID=UPI002DD61E81|nr:DUF3306 domain-containing protein [Pseudorhodoferax sp.]